MPRNYRPRPIQTYTCAHCAIRFETNHSRTKYCGDSCRVKAFYARQGIETQSKQKPSSNLELSPENVFVTAAGAFLGGGAVALINYFTNDLPFEEQLINALTAMQQENRFALNQLLAVAQEQSDYIQAVKEENAGLHVRIEQLELRRQQKQQLAATKEQLKRALVTKKFGLK